MVLSLVQGAQRARDAVSVTDAARVPSIEIRDLSKNFREVKALQGVSLLVESGEFVSFLGPSGCGKTTLLRIIAGLEIPTSGKIIIAGKDVERAPPYARNIGLVFQNYALFPHKTVADNIGFGLRHRAALKAEQRKQGISEALALVRLGDYGNRKPSELSGGQQQRVALARAIVTRPEVLLLDEPLSNLDAKLREDMRFELKELHRTLGMTFVYVTHDRAEALSMSDRLVVMRDGRVDQLGTPKEVFEEPASVAVARFMGNDNILPVEVTECCGGMATVRIEGGGLLTARAPSSMRGGHRAWLLIYNNGIALQKSGTMVGPPLGGNLRGRLKAMFYQGLRLEAHVELSSGVPLRAELHAHQNRDIQPGDTVDVEVHPASTWILDREKE
jgi:ABC-type Fe3+/spermidine/putrescine transport system ATPase subunit